MLLYVYIICNPLHGTTGDPEWFHGDIGRWILRFIINFTAWSGSELTLVLFIYSTTRYHMRYRRASSVDNIIYSWYSDIKKYY